MVVNRVPLKKSAYQHNFRRENLQSGCHGFGVLAKNARPFLDYFHDARIAGRRGLKNDRRQHGHFHFVGGLRPAHQFVQIIHRKRAQDFCCELDFAAVEIVFAQNQSQRLDAEKITTTRVA